MPKIVLDNISTLERLAKINENFQKIEDYINDKVYSRQSDGNPNSLLDNLDVNNKRLLNIPEASSPTDPVRQVDMENYLEDEFVDYLKTEYGLGDGYDASIWDAKQNTLVSGVNIKTVNGASLLGSGDIVIEGGSGGGGTTNHSLLTNRDIADQHPIASITGLTVALDSKASSTHTHALSDVTGLETALAGKASAVHVHDIAGVTGLQLALDSKAASTHTHAIADVTNLQVTLDGKASTDIATTSVNGLMSSTDKTKLNGVATGATANATDASLRDRATHTGSQAISTVTGLQTALDGKQAASANIRNIHIGTTAPGDTSFLWLDTN